jgi:hypothetical protein
MAEAHCKRCRYYTHEWSPRPGESWDRCAAPKLRLADGDFSYCSQNKDNTCSEFKRTWNPLYRWHPKGKWWESYL